MRNRLSLIHRPVSWLNSRLLLTCIGSNLTSWKRMAFTQLEMLLSQNIDHFPKQSTTRQLQVRSERSSQIKFKLFSTHNFNYLHLYISMQVFGFFGFCFIWWFWWGGSIAWLMKSSTKWLMTAQIEVSRHIGLVNREKPSQFDLISCDQSKQQGSTLSSLAVKLLFWKSQPGTPHVKINKWAGKKKKKEMPLVSSL